MRLRKIFMIFLLSIFMAVQVVPLAAMDRPDKPVVHDPTGTGPGDDDDNGEEHPWQDNEGDDDDEGELFGKGMDFIMSLVKSIFKSSRATIEKPESKSGDNKFKDKSRLENRRLFK
ncbi:MAG: hypothetical protein GF404_11255 [candidate division Zixibacteria bacterium]|jgi:hypothetical protein|nr:hypothetical protein [candidate division Zixibacteria bacterium]